MPVLDTWVPHQNARVWIRDPVCNSSFLPIQTLVLVQASLTLPQPRQTRLSSWPKPWQWQVCEAWTSKRATLILSSATLISSLAQRTPVFKQCSVGFLFCFVFQLTKHFISSTTAQSQHVAFPPQPQNHSQNLGSVTECYRILLWRKRWPLCFLSLRNDGDSGFISIVIWFDRLKTQT